MMIGETVQHICIRWKKRILKEKSGNEWKEGLSQCILYGKVKPVTRALNFSLPNENLSSVDITEKKSICVFMGMDTSD